MDLAHTKKDPCCAIKGDSVAEGGVVASAVDHAWRSGLNDECRAIKMRGFVDRSKRAAAQRVGAEVSRAKEGARPTFSRKWTERLHVTRGGWELCVIESRWWGTVRSACRGVARGAVLLNGGSVGGPDFVGWPR